MSVIISFSRVTWCAKRKAPIAPVLFGAIGYMTELTAEQKTCSGKFFGCVGLRYIREIPKGESLGRVLVTLGRAKVTASRHERLSSKLLLLK